MNKATLLTNKEILQLLQNCLAGDSRGQKKIYNVFSLYCLRVCAPYIKNEHELAEVVNDGFVKIFAQLHRFDLTCSDLVYSFQGWTKKIMINTAIDHLRKTKKYQSAKLVLPEKISVRSFENPIDRISFKETIEAVNRVSPGYRLVFRLYALSGCSHREIANLLDISISTSKSNLSRARKQLKQMLIAESGMSLYK
jgi:RNA polymerase sigma factor (sigma-70 family)